ncbi:MAG: hypothetical protein AVDCRST_MAG66-2609, partial [uncultured Pseudonocardia sp.]
CRGAAEEAGSTSRWRRAAADRGAPAASPRAGPLRSA